MNVSLLGTGLMGVPMAGRLIERGHQVTVYNRTREKTKALARAGARVAATAAEAIQKTEAVILMLTDAAAVEDVVFGHGKPDLKRRTVIQMGTIAPEESRKFLVKVNAAGGEYLECPVLGSRQEAGAGQLILMVGSRPDQFERWKDLLNCFGPGPRYIGRTGQAAALKLALNQLIASLTAAFSLSLGLVLKEKIDPEIFMGILRSSALYAPTFDKKLPRLLQGKFDDPNFPVKHLVKDVDLILSTCRGHGLAVDALEGVRALLNASAARGRAEEDYSALFTAVDPNPDSSKLS